MWETLQNLPKLLDEITSGLIVLAYDLVLAFTWPLVSPVRGTAGLRHRSSTHVGSRTALLVAAMILTGLGCFGSYALHHLEREVEKPTVINFTINTGLLFFSSDLAAMGIAHFVARRRARRARAAELLRFTIAASVALAALMAVLLAGDSNVIDNVFLWARSTGIWHFDLDRELRDSLVAGFVVCLAFYPAIVVLWKLRRKPTVVFRLISIVAVPLFVFFLSDYLDANSLGLSQEPPRRNFEKIKLLEGTCFFEKPKWLVVNTAIYNGSDVPVLMDSSSFRVIVKKTTWTAEGPKEGVTESVMDRFGQINPPYPVTDPGKVGQTSFRIDASDSQLLAPNARTFCTIEFSPRIPSLESKSGMDAYPTSGTIKMIPLYEPSQSSHP